MCKALHRCPVDIPDRQDRLRAGGLSVTVGDTSGPSGGAACPSTAHRVEGKKAADLPQPRLRLAERVSGTASQAKRSLVLPPAQMRGAQHWVMRKRERAARSPQV